jgi:hypothetical protein
MLLAALLLLQAPPIAVTVSLDRNQVQVGEDVVYSLRAVTSEAGPIRVELPQSDGLEVIARTERTDPPIRGERSYHLELTLRAAEVGAWRYGPVVIMVGAVTEVAPEVLVTVAGTASAEPSRNPLLLELIRRVPPPNPGSNATLALVVSAQRLFQGDQLDLLTAAWFPRSLRVRLRRPPTLKPPVLAGVWSVPQRPIPGIVASRPVGEEIYDLFISHQVAYPLAPGRLAIPPARLEYAVPMTRRASGDERPVEAASEGTSVLIEPAPAGAGGIRGPQGRDLSLGYRIRALPAHAGEVLPIEIILSGEGNLAFWPPPNVTWPPGTRAYLDRTSEAIRSESGRLGGLKTFHFLLLADSVGSVALPALSYDYFDPRSGTLRAATAPGVVVPVLPARASGPPRPVPPLVRVENDWTVWSLLIVPSTRWWWAAVLAPVVVGGVVLAWRRRPRRAARAGDGAGDLVVLDRLVNALVPEGDRGEPDRLEGSLRQAGVGAGTARELARLKLEADWGRFAPGQGINEPALGARARELLRRVPAGLRRGIPVAVLLVATQGLTQGTAPPESLYRDRSYDAAAAGFHRRARAEPTRWQHWYHAAAADFLAGRDAAAAAALARARALAPRAPQVLALWETLERQYEPLRSVGRPRLSRAEWAIVSILLWWLGAAALLIRRIPRQAAATLAAAGLLAVILPAALRPWTPTGFTARTVELRRSPHGLAPENGSLGALTPVTAAGHRPGWVLVVDRQGNRGWVPQAAVVSSD